MRVAKYYRHDDIRVEEMPVPKISPGELLVQVKACGLCGSDAMTWYADEKAPTVLGHEPTGLVAEVGEGVKGFAIGDRVFAHHHVACLVCHYCRRGDYPRCDTFRATHIDPGGFAEYIRVPALNVERDVLLLPEEVSFEEGTLIEPVACGVRGMRRVRVEPGDTVLVLGAGVSGLIFAQLARLWGAGLVVVVDFVEYRLDVAKRLGADLTIEAGEGALSQLEAFNEGRGADLVIVTPGTIRAMEEGIRLAGRGGTVLLYAPSYPGERLPLDTNDIFWRELTLTTTYSCSHKDTRTALEFIRRGRVQVEPLITHRLGLDQVAEGLRLMAEAQESLKIVIVPFPQGYFT